MRLGPALQAERSQGGSGCQEAGEGTRTLDIQLGKLALYQLSYARSVYRHPECSREKPARHASPDGGRPRGTATFSAASNHAPSPA